MPLCCIVRCGLRKNKNQPELTLHRFPRSEILKKKWLDAIGVENINPRHKELYVCSLHFEECSFNRTLDVVRLHDNDNAMPSNSLVAQKRPSTCNQQASTLKQNKNLPSASDMQIYEQKTSILREKSNMLETCSSVMKPPLLTTINAEGDIEKVRRNEEILRLQQTCKKQRNKIKRLHEKVRKRIKKIANDPDHNTNHRFLLIKSVIKVYLDIRFRYHGRKL